MKQLLFLVIFTITIIGIESSTDCSSPECLSFVEAMKKYMNNQTDPCDNFYEYACGNWEKHNAVPKDEENWGVSDIMEQETRKKIKEMFNDSVGARNASKAFRKARKMYRSCMNLETIERKGLRSIIAILNEDGGWPVMMAADDWTPDVESLCSMYTRYEKELDLNSFYSFDISPGFKNLSLNQLHIDAPSISDFMTISLNYERNSSEIADLISNVTEIVKIFVNETGNNVDVKNMKNDVNDMVDFIYKLAKLVDVEEGTTQEEEISMTYKDFLEFYKNQSHTDNSKIISKDFFKDYFHGIHPGLHKKHTIYITRPNYLLNVTKLLDSTPMRTLVNYIQLNVILKLIQGAPKRLRDIAFKLEQIDSDIQVEPEREIMCIDWLKENMAVNYEYVRRYGGQDIKTLVKEMFSKILAATNETLNETPWLSRDEHEYINQKLSSMKYFVSYPDWYGNPSEMNNYTEYEISSNYISNIIEVKKWEVVETLEELNDVVSNSTEMDTDPLESEAAYSPDTNSIEITLAQLQPPIFSKNYPRIIQYAAFGEFIGHEISHAFDGDSCKPDVNSNNRSWCSNATQEVLRSKFECFVKQFDEYKTYDTVNETIYENGTATLDENIADLHGLKIAYRAYQDLKISDNITLPGFEKYTPDQIFFLAHAAVSCGVQKPSYLRGDAQEDTHATLKSRINGRFANMKEFSSAFHCPVNSTMNPSNKCIIWGTDN